MRQIVRLRQENTLDYQASGLKGVELGRITKIRNLILKLECQPTVVLGSNTNVLTMRGDGWGVVKAIRLIANGSDAVRDISGIGLWNLNRFLFGFNPPILGRGTNAAQSALMGDTIKLGDAATANPFISQQLVLPLALPDSLVPVDTSLHSGLLQNLRLECQWGLHTDVNSAATGFTTAPTLTVLRSESFDAPTADGQPADSAPPLRSLIKPYTWNLAASVSDYQLDMPLGGVIRGFMINCANAAGTADLAAGAGLTRIRIKSGGQIVYDAPWDMIVNGLRFMKGKYCDNVIRTAAAVATETRPMISSNYNADAWGWVDFCPDFVAYLTEAFDTRGLGELKMEVTSAAAMTLTVWPVIVNP